MKRVFYIFCILALTTAAGFCQDALTILPDGTVEVNGRITASGGVENAILPVGTILMYDGSEIADAGTRTEKIGDHSSDKIDFDLHGSWYVCNGNSGAPNLINTFIRGEVKSGKTGGSDDAVLIKHTHSFVDYTSHSSNQGAGHIDKFRKGTNDVLWKWNVTHNTGSAGSVSDGKGKNMPVYYSVIFVIRKQ